MNFPKNTLCLGAVALIGLAFISHASAESHMSKKPHHEAGSHEHHSNPSAKDKTAMGEGVIHSIIPIQFTKQIKPSGKDQDYHRSVVCF